MCSRARFFPRAGAGGGLSRGGGWAPGRVGEGGSAPRLLPPPPQPQRHRRGGKEPPPLLEEFAGAGEQRRRLLQAARFLEDEAPQGFRLYGVEDGQLEVVTNASLVL